MLTYSDRSPALASVRLTPEPPDDEIAALCDSFTVRDAPGRDAVRQALEPRDHGTLFTFAQRMAVLAMRESSPRRLHHGPTALVMSDVAHLDSWDIASASGLLRHAASHLGLEGGDLIRSVAALAVPDVARHMAGAADAHDLPIATGCNVVLTKYGFGLVGWWLHDYAPTCDLTGLTIELAELVEADQDEVESIVLAADVPIVWLPAPGHLDVAACLARVRAAASLNAGMLTGQMLMLFVAECSSPADAARLAESVSLTHLHDCARLAAAVGPLFGLAVARATFQGKSTVETDASLGASVRVSSQH